VNGEVMLKFLSEVSASFSINGHGGRIVNRLSNDEVRRDRYGPGSSLEFSLGTGAGKVEIETVNGEITLEN